MLLIGGFLGYQVAKWVYTPKGAFVMNNQENPELIITGNIRHRAILYGSAPLNTNCNSFMNGENLSIILSNKYTNRFTIKTR